MNSTFERVRGVVVEVMNIVPERVCPETDIASELGPDSLEQVEIVMGLETEFNLDLGEDQSAFGTVNDVVSRIDKQLEYH